MAPGLQNALEESLNERQSADFGFDRHPVAGPNPSRVLHQDRGETLRAGVGHEVSVQPSAFSRQRSASKCSS